jgi:hypothetical protein
MSAVCNGTNFQAQLQRNNGLPGVLECQAGSAYIGRAIQRRPNPGNTMNKEATLGELRASGYRVLPLKDELRANLIRKMRAKENLFPGIIGYEQTVVPALVNAILARHDIILLGLRGQAKSRIVRQLTSLLD